MELNFSDLILTEVDLQLYALTPMTWSLFAASSSLKASYESMKLPGTVVIESLVDRQVNAVLSRRKICIGKRLVTLFDVKRVKWARLGR